MRWLGQSTGALRRVYPMQRVAVFEFLSRDPVANVLAMQAFEAGRGTAVCIYGDDGEIRSVACLGSNIVPVGFDAEGLAKLADHLLRTPGYSGSIVGASDQVLGLWELLDGKYLRPAREVRAHQPSMVAMKAGEVVPGLVGADFGAGAGVGAGSGVGAGAGVGGVGVGSPAHATGPLVAPDPQVRPAVVGEGPLVVPAAVAMYMEELGYDPTAFGPQYARRAHELVARGHTFVRMGLGPDGRRQVIFKADIGALAGGVAQIQGVWTHPEMRGRGIASAAMVRVVELIQATIAPTVSLYVNDFNKPALKAYEKAGFVTVGEYATILLKV